MELEDSSSDNHLKGDDPKKEVRHDFDFPFHHWIVPPFSAATQFSPVWLWDTISCIWGIFRFNKSKARTVSSNPHTSECSIIAKSSFQFSLVTIVSKIIYIKFTVQWTGITMHFEILG